MASRRELVLEALKALVTAALPGAEVVRNSTAIGEAGPGGRVNILDGEPGEPEITLSPLQYTYQHRVSLEILPYAPSHSALDTMLAPIGAAIAADRTLGGLTDFLEPQAPDLSQRDVEGALQIDWAEVGLIATYTTSNPLL